MIFFALFMITFILRTTKKYLCNHGSTRHNIYSLIPKIPRDQKLVNFYLGSL